VIRGNGIFDLLCAVSILCINAAWNPLSHIHSSLFTEMTPQNKRMLGYWMCTYGLIRLYSDNWMLVSSSYAIEFTAFLHEWQLKSLTKLWYKNAFVVLGSLLLGLLCCSIFFEEDVVRKHLPF